MKKIAALLVLTMLIALPINAFAASPWTNEKDWADKSWNKLSFGAKNLLLGWTELFTETADGYHAGNTLKGLGIGVVNTIADTVGGAIHVITFPIPVDVPLPQNGVNFGS